MATMDQITPRDPLAPLAEPPAPALGNGDAADEDPEILQEAALPGEKGQRARPRIREFEAIVEEAIRETPDSTTLVFFTGGERMEYQAGQFLTIRPHQFPALDRFVKFFQDVKGKPEPARAYSICSAPHDRRPAVT